MFIDHAEIKLISGTGGNGASTFRREKFIQKGGPNGGDGGRGASIYFESDSNLTTLVDFHYKRVYEGEKGINGLKQNMMGANAKDLVIRVPVGTIIKNAATGAVIKDFVKAGEKVLIVKCGRGGRGNTRFKSSTRQAPRFYEKGEPGEEVDVVLELKMLADVGIIGMANAGKSTFLSKVSNARPKIGDYQFTTLSPNLGIVKIGDDVSFVAADIPGLIEGASSGKGLGIDFLKHIERTRIYLHVVDVTQGDVITNFDMINNELSTYDEKMMERPQVVIVNKMDLLREEEIVEINKKFEERGIEIILTSAKDNIGLDKAINRVYNILKDLPDEEVEELAMEVIEQVEILELEKIDTVETGDVYTLHNKRLEKYMKMLDFNSDETWEVFRNHMEKSGINDFLKEKGLKNGDIIVINEKDFAYEEDPS